MEIRVGIANIGRELSFETESSADDIRAAVADALESKAASVSFTDSKGSSYIVPTASLAYVEIGTEESRRIGFVA
ncbi:DUF3107 domain-containing protein [Microbacterium sp. NC79]|uniref:DUF3107 domain-containing protein n=1 Tax=Microbacterium sp. NC79 TaxID=2851009 RepID=UPI001C2C0BB2|nr:DUF3107 domain-containing protein [Microbacterium sp. NC79]